MISVDEYLRDLQYLCSIDSGHANAEGTSAMADWFEERYRALGLKTFRYFYAGNDYAPVLLATNSSCADPLQTDELFDVLFLAHMDTVFDTQTVRSWPLVVDENGIGRGPGCVDCKGGCLLVYYLIRDILEKGDCRFRFCIVYNSDEESGSRCSREYFELLAKRVKFCLVFEPGRENDEYVGIRKGGVKYKIAVHGVGGHAGVDFEKGSNAIVELSRWIPKLTELTDIKEGTTLNVSQIHGGSSDGQIPDYAELHFGMMYLERDALQRLNQLLEHMKKSPFDPKCSIETEQIEPGRPPLFINENSKKLLSALQTAAKKCGTTSEWISTGGMSDGNWFAHFGVGTLDGCGPCGGALHTKNEFIKTGTIVQRFETMRALLHELFEKEMQR